MKHLPRDQEAVNRNLRDRLRNEERRRPANPRPTTEEIAPFSAAGAVAVTTSGEEPQWRVQTGGQIVSVSLHLKTAGSSTTTITVYLNGASIGTVSLASSATDTVAYLGDYRAKNGDLIGVRITTAGSGAKGLSAFVRMKG